MARECNKIRFWEQRWWGDYSFEDFYPILFQLSSVHDKSIYHFIQLEDSSSSSFILGLHFRRDLRDEKVVVVSSLLGSLERVGQIG